MTIAAKKIFCDASHACDVVGSVDMNVAAGNHYYSAGLPFDTLEARFSYRETGALIVSVSNGPLVSPIYRNGLLVQSPDADELVITPGTPTTFRFRASSLGSGERVEWAIGGEWGNCVAIADEELEQVTQLQVVIKREESSVVVSCS